jgi:hypothetical protein
VSSRVETTIGQFGSTEYPASPDLPREPAFVNAFVLKSSQFCIGVRKERDVACLSVNSTVVQSKFSCNFFASKTLYRLL